VELLASCGRFHTGTAGSLGTWLPHPCPQRSKQNIRSLSTWLPHPCPQCSKQNICTMAHMPRLATLGMVWKTAALSTSGTSGLVMPHGMSHSRLAPSTWTVSTIREEDLGAFSMLGQLAWLAAILVKEMPKASCTSDAMPGSLPCLPAVMQLETRRALLHTSPPGEAPLLPRVLVTWRECLPPH
jgi:hypothetical protein